MAVPLVNSVKVNMQCGATFLHLSHLQSASFLLLAHPIALKAGWAKSRKRIEASSSSFAWYVLVRSLI